MDLSSREILEAALRLSEQEREQIADALYQSLPLSEELVSEEFRAELDRRYEEVVRGDVTLIPWSQLRDEK